MEKLTDLPNIGPVLAGAAAGARKSLLPPERKAELKAWFHTL